MKVKEVIEKLKEYNPEAKFCIVVNGSDKNYEICFGGAEGVTKENCDSVDFMIDTPCEIKGELKWDI